MNVQLTWTDCDELSPRDLVSRPDNMDETVLHTILQNKKSYDLETLHAAFVAQFKLYKVFINADPGLTLT